MGKGLVDYSFADGKIQEILIREETVQVQFLQWNHKSLVLEFQSCYQLVDRNSIGQDIEYVVEFDQTDDLETVIKSFLEDGVENEVLGLKQYSFISSWDNNSLL